MEFNKRIVSMVPGDEIEGYYILKSASVRTTSAGKPYLNAMLSDASGSVEAKMWDFSGTFSPEEEGTAIKIRGEVGEFKGANQITIRKMRQVTSEDEYDVSLLIPTAPIDAMKELDFVQNLISTVEDDDYRRICETMLDRHIISFSRIPAGKSMHHSFLSGLLMHTGNMLRIADFLSSEIYPDAVDRSLLITGTLLHDFAKDKEYAVSSLGTITGMTVEGNLLGHLVMCSEEIDKVGADLGIPGEKIMLLKHMILSHHGQPEFGAAVIPCIAEAELLSYIDLIDSRMEIYAETFERVPVGSFSDKIYALDKRIYNHE